jgi:hypothetical protein
MQAMDAQFYGTPRGLGQSLPNPFDSNVTGTIGNSSGTSGSATDGLGQINKGSQTVGTALQRAQQATKASSEAIGGGGKPNVLGPAFNDMRSTAMKKGGKVEAYAKGSSVSSASSRGDGIAQRGKTRGRMC